jgi:hypothetical protein
MFDVRCYASYKIYIIQIKYVKTTVILRTFCSRLADLISTFSKSIKHAEQQQPIDVAMIALVFYCFPAGKYSIEVN